MIIFGTTFGCLNPDCRAEWLYSVEARAIKGKRCSAVSPNPPVPSPIYHYLHYLPHKEVHSFTSSSLTFFFFFKRALRENIRWWVLLLFYQTIYTKLKVILKPRQSESLDLASVNNSSVRSVILVTKFQFFHRNTLSIFFTINLAWQIIFFSNV